MLPARAAAALARPCVRHARRGHHAVSTVTHTTHSATTPNPSGATCYRFHSEAAQVGASPASACTRRTATARPFGPSSALAPWGTASAVGATRSLFGQTFDVGAIEAYPRQETGSRRMNRARKAGLVPSVLYGRRADGTDAEPQLLFLEERDVAREIRKRGKTLENTLFDLTINGETVRVLPRQLEMHPFKPIVYRLNFIRYNPGQHPGARIRIPFKTMNEDRCPALKEGGWLLQLQYSLPVFATGETIPDYLMIDLRGKTVGSKVQVSELYLNEGLSLRTKQGRPTEFPVAKLIGSRRGAVAKSE